MRIALDARTIYRPQRRGTGKNLIDLYRRVARRRPHWHVTAFHREGRSVEPLLPQPQVTPRHIEAPGDRFNAWLRWRLPIAARLDGADVLHCPANNCPGWIQTPTVVTIHDLIPLDMATHLPSVDVKRFEQSIATAARHAAGIICPSRYTADRLIREYHAEPSRVNVIPWAPDSSLHRLPPQTDAALRRRYNVDQPFVLHFGSAAPRKNTHRLIHAWSQLPADVRADWTLLIVGLDDDAKRDFGDALQRFGAQRSVQLHGFADEADLPALLHAADVLAYPSLSEGFGLPILDAWLTRAAVLTSNVTSLPEVAGDAALQVDPHASAAITDGLEQLLTDRKCRDTFIQRGARRVKAFTWEATATRFIAAMEAAVGAKPAPMLQAA